MIVVCGEALIDLFVGPAEGAEMSARAVAGGSPFNVAIGRMRILSSDDVIEAAEKVGHLIIETYLSPNKTILELPELLAPMDPLRRFSEACRRELKAVHGP